MNIGKHVSAARYLQGFPRDIVTQATLYDDNERLGGFVVGLNSATPGRCGLDRIKPCLSPAWTAFLDSYSERKGNGWRFWCVIHRSDIPRSEFEGRIRP